MRTREENTEHLQIYLCTHSSSSFLLLVSIRSIVRQSVLYLYTHTRNAHSCFCIFDMTFPFAVVVVDVVVIDVVVLYILIKYMYSIRTSADRSARH